MPSGEDDLISRFFAPLAGAAALGLRDDAALLRPSPGSELVLTADALVAGVHFFADDPPASIGRKCVGVNLSDLAAKGADPVGYLLTIALPDGWTEDWLEAFCRGLREEGAASACPLLGGDTVRTPGPLTITVTAIGTVPVGRMVRRTGARPGDAICVTGSIGDAWLGLALSQAARPGWADSLSASETAFLVDRYRHPQPRLALRDVLRAFADGAMDVSDGLSGDLAKLLQVSGIGGELELDRVPVSSAARTALTVDPHLADELMSGGDDYEILCTVPLGEVAAFLREAAEVGISVTQVGVTRAEAGLSFLRQGEPYPLRPLSFSHM